MLRVSADFLIETWGASDIERRFVENEEINFVLKT